MDPNRDLSEAVFSQSENSAVAYNDYHNFIENYFCKNFMLNSSFQQGNLILCRENQIHSNLIIPRTFFGYSWSST